MMTEQRSRQVASRACRAAFVIPGQIPTRGRPTSPRPSGYASATAAQTPCASYAAVPRMQGQVVRTQIAKHLPTIHLATSKCRRQNASMDPLHDAAISAARALCRAALPDWCLPPRLAPPVAGVRLRGPAQASAVPLRAGAAAAPARSCAPRRVAALQRAPAQLLAGAAQLPRPRCVLAGRVVRLGQPAGTSRGGLAESRAARDGKPMAAQPPHRGQTAGAPCRGAPGRIALAPAASGSGDQPAEGHPVDFTVVASWTLARLCPRGAALTALRAVDRELCSAVDAAARDDAPPTWPLTMSIIPDGLVARTFEFPPELTLTLRRPGGVSCAFWSHDGRRWRRAQVALPATLEGQLRETLVGLYRSRYYGRSAQFLCACMKEQVSAFAPIFAAAAEAHDRIFLYPQPEGAMHRLLVEDSRKRTVLDHLFLDQCGVCEQWGKDGVHQRMLEELREFVQSRPLQSAEWPPMLVID